LFFKTAYYNDPSCKKFYKNSKNIIKFSSLSFHVFYKWNYRTVYLSINIILLFQTYLISLQYWFIKRNIS